MHAAMPRRRAIVELDDGTRVVLASGWRVLGTFGIDVVASVLVPSIVFLAIWRGHDNAMRTALLTAVIVWPLFAFGYGLFSAGGRTPGGFACGTRMVHIPSGRSLGAWRQGLHLFLMGFVLVLLLANEMAPGRVRRADEAPVERNVLIDVAASRALDSGGCAAPLTA